MKYKAAWLAVGWVLASMATQAAPREQRPAGDFDFYVLSLSWSPTFCLAHPNNEQCSGKGYGFVLHGLWPQYARGGWPASCDTQSRLSADELAKGALIFPTQALLKHEWSKHGTCSGLEATRYLQATDAALATVQIPANCSRSTCRVTWRHGRSRRSFARRPGHGQPWRGGDLQGQGAVRSARVSEQGTAFCRLPQECENPVPGR